MTIWVCERCPGSPMFVTRGDTENDLLNDVEDHRVALHQNMPGAVVWIEHDDWERVANDWNACPLCKAEVTVNLLSQQWLCSDPMCTLASADKTRYGFLGGYPLSTLQLVG